MIDAGAIRENKSPFLPNVVLVCIKDKSLHFCIDFCKLNSSTIKDAYAFPRIDESIDSLAGLKFFMKLDRRVLASCHAGIRYAQDSFLHWNSGFL